MRYLPFIALILAGCATPPCTPEIVEIVQTERVPVPSALTGPCVVDCGEIVTNGDLLECHQMQRRALADCDARMSEIRGLR
jgi:hypothetical protein